MSVNKARTTSFISKFHFVEQQNPYQHYPVHTVEQECYAQNLSFHLKIVFFFEKSTNFTNLCCIFEWQNFILEKNLLVKSICNRKLFESFKNTQITILLVSFFYFFWFLQYFSQRKVKIHSKYSQSTFSTILFDQKGIQHVISKFGTFYVINILFLLI